MSRTLYQKLVDSHTVARVDAQHVMLYADFHIMNEYTSPQAFGGLDEKNILTHRPEQNMGVVDHVNPTHPDPIGKRTIRIEAPAKQAANFVKNCNKHGIRIFDINDPIQGIEHVVVPEIGCVRPGMVILCGDSHTVSYGALGALGFGIGTSEVEHVLATQTLIYRVCKNMRITVNGDLKPGVSSKDVIMYIVAKIGAQGARGYAIEFAGTTFAKLSTEARLTISNMAVESGARAALLAPDETTFNYVREHVRDMSPADLDKAVEAWKTLRSDDGAQFDLEYTFDAADIEPYVTWGTSPDQAIAISEAIPTEDKLNDDDRKALDYIGLKPGMLVEGTPINRAFIGSCTNARIEDLRLAAGVIKGRKVAPGVRAMIIPGSGLVRAQAEREGLAQQFIDAGFEWRQPGCSMCLAMNDDYLEPGERCASSTNRNFEGRQGRGGLTHLMSPIMVAAAAIAGRIVDVRKEF